MVRGLLKYLLVLAIIYGNVFASNSYAENEGDFVGPLPVEDTEQKDIEKDDASEEVSAELKNVSVASFINSSGKIKVEGFELSKEILAEVYSPREYTTIWFDGKVTNKNYEKAIKFISLADENGLSRSYFDVNIIRKRVEDENQNEQFIAKTDALITQMVVEMIRLIGNGHKIPAELKLQTYFERPVRVKNPVAAFKEFMATDDIDSIIEKYSPKHEQYKFLKKALNNNIRKHEGHRELKPIPYTRDLFIGDKDSTIVELRRKLGARVSISPGSKNNVYDKLLAEKVNEFKKVIGLEPNGVINKEFIESLNTHDIETISRIKANMERYRWLPDDMPAVRLEVNVPDYSLKAYKDGKLDFSMGVIAGKNEHETPIMSTRLYQFTLNPYWNVPKSYAIRNMLPLLRQDPNYVKNQNFDLLKLEKEGWKSVDQSTVNWDTITADNYGYLMRQRPGNINVLGPIKFALINPFDIFMHSTSEPWLFTNKFRGYSSGCIRVEDPIKFAKFVREHGGADISDERFNELYNYYNAKDGIPMPQKPEFNDRVVKLKTPIPVFVTYFSVHADEGGSIKIDDDTYELDFNQSKHLGF